VRRFAGDRALIELTLVQPLPDRGAARPLPYGLEIQANEPGRLSVQGRGRRRDGLGASRWRSSRYYRLVSLFLLVFGVLALFMGFFLVWSSSRSGR